MAAFAGQWASLAERTTLARLRVHRIVFASLLLVASGVSTPAWAGDYARLALTREPNASECPDEQALRDAVSARLGYEPFTADATSVVEVVFRRDHGTLHASVVLRDGAGHVKGERSLSSARGDCQEVASATTLTISILLDPRSGLAPKPAPTSETAPTKAAPSEAEPPPTTPPTPAPTPTPAPAKPIAAPAKAASNPPSARIDSRSPTWLFTTTLTSAFGNSPLLTLGVLLGVGVQGRGWSARAEFREDLPTDALSDELAVELDDSTQSLFGSPRVHTRFTAADLAPCGHFGLGYACGVLTLGSLQGDIAGGASSRQFHALVGPRLGIDLPLGRGVSFNGHVDATYALTQLTLRDGGADLWHSSRLTALLGVGLSVRYP